MNAPVDHIPSVLLEEARQAGLDAPAILTRWAKYVDWHVKHHGDRDYRVADWRRHIGWEIDDQRKAIPKPLSSDEQSGVRRLRQHELEQALADELYDREKVSFEDWIRGLEERERMLGDPLTAHEKAFLEWRRRQLIASRPAHGVTSLWAFGIDSACRCHGGEHNCERAFRPRQQVG